MSTNPGERLPDNDHDILIRVDERVKVLTDKFDEHLKAHEESERERRGVIRWAITASIAASGSAAAVIGIALRHFGV